MGSQTPILALPYPVGTDLIADGDNAIQSLALAVESLLAGTWLTLPGVTGVPVGGGYLFPQYLKLGHVVELRGIAQYNSGIAVQSVVATLPVGARPTQGTETFRVDSVSGAVRVDVGTNGQLILQTAVGAGHLSFSGIRFRTN